MTNSTQTKQRNETMKSKRLSNQIDKQLYEHHRADVRNWCIGRTRLELEESLVHADEATRRTCKPDDIARAKHIREYLSERKGK